MRDTNPRRLAALVGATFILALLFLPPAAVAETGTGYHRDPVTITSGDFFDEVGDYYRCWSNVSNVSVVGLIGPPGGPQTWDFTTGPDQQIKRFDCVETDDGDDPGIGFYAADHFPEADFAQRMTEETAGGQAWMYLSQVPDTGRVNYGFYQPDGNIETDDWSVFTPPIVDFPDPLNHMDQWQVTTTYYLQMYDMGTTMDVRVDYVSDCEVDAWGTVVLPDLGSIEALRVNNAQTSDVYVWLGGEWYQVSTQFVRSYYWIGSGSDLIVEIDSVVSEVSMPPIEFSTAGSFLRQFENSNPTAPPDIAEIPDQAVYETYSIFTYDADASGTPEPTFSLAQAPDGMTIGETSGLIEWTPESDDVGEETVIVQADNGSGTDTEEFVISVLNLNEPPRNLVTQLFNSGTVELSWEPPASTYWLAAYGVYHTSDAGGPYERVTSAGPGETSCSLGTAGFCEPGFYVVTAELETGRESFESVPSNERMAYSLVPWQEGLSNDDDTAELGHQAGGANGEMAAKLELPDTTTVRLTHVAVYLTDMNGSPITMKVYADDAGGYPGSSLAQMQYPASMLRQGWNVLEIPEFMQPSFSGGGFFVGAVEGASNNTVGLDDSTYAHSFTRAPGGDWSFLFTGELMFRGIVEGPGSGVVEQEISSFRLLGCYPNPTDGGSRIAFSIPESRPVSLRIVDPSGRVVATPIERPMEAGLHTVEWNGRSESGRPVANGVYLFEVSAGNEVERGRVLVLR